MKYALVTFVNTDESGGSALISKEELEENELKDFFLSTVSEIEIQGYIEVEDNIYLDGVYKSES